MNKYLEKIAKMVDGGEGEKKSRKAAWGTFGRTVGFGALGSPIPAGGLIGGVYGYRTGIQKHAPNVKKEDLTSQAIRGYARASGRGLVEAIGAGGAGAAAGAGAAHMLSKVKRFAPEKAQKTLAMGAAIGGSVGAVAGNIHGAYKSTKNKLDELTGRKKK